MAITDSIRSTPRPFFITFGLLVLGGLFVLTAIASPDWLVGFNGQTFVQAGLWESCGDSLCITIPPFGIYIVLRALCMLALLGAGGSGLAALAFIVVEQRRKPLGYLVAIGCLLSSISNTITVVIYSIAVAISTGTVGLGWSFILACLGCACLFFASIPAFVVTCNLQPTNPQSRFI